MSLLEQKLKEFGFFEFGTVNTADIIFRQEIRAMCEVNTCRLYGKSWACPPAVGTVEECERRIKGYDTMLVLTGKYELEDSFDYEGMQNGMKAFRAACRDFLQYVKSNINNFIMLSNEGCDLCEECTYPSSPCRFPDRAMGSLEAYGIFVSELANQAGVRYNNGQNTVTYLGGLVLNKSSLETLF